MCIQEVECLINVMQQTLIGISSLLWIDKPTWTEVLLHIDDEALFRMVSHIRSQDGIDSTNATISADHGNPVCTSLEDGIEDLPHTVVEEAVSCY